MPDMKKIVALTFESVKSYLKPNKACFELFGFDFLVDKEGESILIEVNTNPCLEESSPLL